MPRCQEIYQRYAAVLYRQALLQSGDLAPAGQDVGDVIVNEHALAAIARCTRVTQTYGTPEPRRDRAGIMDTRRVRVWLGDRWWTVHAQEELE
jgi:hypothetical protein